ncbi:DUF4855 domain-containing protein [Brevibacillus ruminantium]|uniref:DUF4855 domain-containing protein n=1 Tax=Brevibacillus ruminantium TaxID=2950604 RepID=A0ABY4WFN7_9BACL|nr:DUF4855 domain-containing protein [Brevibacillus ruminantium]USG65968.1 DUF4855 domain-containing protein [Brevibacillus ruminantium]
MTLDSMKFDLRKSNAHQESVIEQMISDLEDFVYEWRRSSLWSKDLYISLPAIDNNQYTMENIEKISSFYPFYKTFMSRARDTVIDICGETFWDGGIDGFYFRTETIFPIQEQISESRPTSNPMVKLLNDISYQVRNNYDKEFMWCPYYGYGKYAKNVTHNLGVIANQTNIFDYICIQPQYYFQGSTYKKNVNRVYDSA